MKLLINSIYLATEGEGIHIGSPQVFVRFQGCAVGCLNCDSKDTWDFTQEMAMHSESVVERVIELSGKMRRVSITGGDPLHPKHEAGVLELVKSLKSRGYYINIEAAGTRVVEVIWPKVANSDNHSWDHHTGLSKRMKDQSAPMLDAGLTTLIQDLDDRGMLEETLVVAIGEFGRSPQRGVSTSGNNNSDDGRDHWPYCYTAVMAGAGIRRGYVHGKSDKTASAPLEKPVITHEQG